MRHLPDVTLIAVDTSPKAYLAARAIDRSLDQCSFGAMRFVSHETAYPSPAHAVIPKLDGLEGYSKFCIQEMHKHVPTSFALVCQADGYVVNGAAWDDAFMGYDYIGAPFNPSNIVGNGGFSLRSKHLMQFIASRNWPDPHPEDSAICIRHRNELAKAGFQIAPLEIARRFAMEGRSWNSVEWQGTPNRWNGQFGFHSWLTPGVPGKPKIFHHSGDAGDVIYSLAVIKAMGGGVLFLSIDNRFPYPLNSRWSRLGGDAAWVDNIKPLLEAQDYVDRVSYTHGLPFSADFDLNRFRLPWKDRTARDFDSILKLHCDAMGVTWDESEPWLTVPDSISVPGRPIVIARSPRYNDINFPWYELVQKYGDRMVFVGEESESIIFQGFGAPKYKIPWRKTANLLELARVIAGAKVFIGNQSAPLAIAHGLCKNAIIEQWKLNSNCRLNRPNALYWEKGPLEIPGEWLK